jgi:hypothetical protein
VGQQISFLAGGDLLAHAQTLKEQHPHTCSFDLVPKAKVLPSGFNSYVAEERTPKGRSYARLHIRPYVPRMASRTDLLSLFLEIVGGTAAL